MTSNFVVKVNALGLLETDLHFVLKPGSKVKLKRDVYFREREKVAKLLNILCAKCGAKVLLYQKDGRGRLHRCYLNRIYDPPRYSKLQGLHIASKKELPNLVCRNCNEVIGYPMEHWEGRLAYRLAQGKWRTQRSEVLGIA